MQPAQRNHPGVSTVLNSTISANLANNINASTNEPSGIMLVYGGDSKLQLRNSIIAGNANGADSGVLGTAETMASYVIRTIANIGRFNADGTNRFTDTPGLGPLQNNGGATQTMALLDGSTAIDTGHNAFSPCFYDQRGASFLRV
jgi:hypothetical protein